MDEIKEVICEIFEKITKQKIVNEDSILLGRPNNLSPRNLVYLLLEVQKRFEISITEEEILNNKFSSVNKIAELVYKRINQK